LRQASRLRTYLRGARTCAAPPGPGTPFGLGHLALHEGRQEILLEGVKPKINNGSYLPEVADHFPAVGHGDPHRGLPRRVLQAAGIAGVPPRRLAVVGQPLDESDAALKVVLGEKLEGKRGPANEHLE
jgi:hypothetical protein